MVFKFLSVAILAAVFGAASVQAQSVARIGGPANLPPAGFQGEQWVDSRGCVFLKAGYGGQVTWVPRVGRDRKALCGYPPTGSTRAKIEIASAEEAARPVAPATPMIEAVPVTAAKPRAVATVAPAAPVIPRTTYTKPAAPAPVVAVAPRQPAPYVEAAPRAGYETVASSGPSAGQIGCYTSAPVAERVKTRDGGTAVVCTRGDGTMTGWRPPIYPQGAGVGASLTDPQGVTQGAVRQARVDHSPAVAGGAYAQQDVVPTPPEGYKMAWDDDRLNPLRGKGTASGWAAQDQVWTRKVPAKLVEDQPRSQRKKKVVYVQTGTQVTTSTKGQPATAPVEKKAMKVAKGGAYIQVGTFGVASNADGAAARLKGIGLPVARAKTTSGGKAVQIVLAGPFASAADAATALSMARGAGFGDAFIR